MPKVPFVVNDIEVDGTTLTVDEVNNRVGIGTNTPGVTLDVVGVLKASDGVITLTSTGTPSTSIADGALAVDTTNDKLFIRSGSAWVEVGGGGGVTDHGALTGLADDDHTQYLLADGTRSATSLDVTGNATVGDIVVDNGANITAHYTGWVKLGASDTSSLGIDRNSIQAFGSSSGTYNTLDINAFGGDILLNRDGGNTKIGGLAPSEKLDVGGNIKLSGNLIVGGTVDGRDVAADGTKLDGIEAGATNPGTDINTTVTTTTDTLAAGDVWKLTQYSNASQVTVTVPTGTFSAGDWFLLQSTGAGGLTLSTTGLTVTGSSTSISEGEVIMIVFTASDTITVIAGADDPKYATINTPVTTTTHTLASGDLFELTQFSNASQVTVTVPTNTFVTGDWFMLQSTGAGGLTLSTTGITVNGAKTTIAESEGMMVVFTGSNTISVFGGTS